MARDNVMIWTHVFVIVIDFVLVRNLPIDDVICEVCWQIVRHGSPCRNVTGSINIDDRVGSLSRRVQKTLHCQYVCDT
jgi:hypothetical protein